MNDDEFDDLLFFDPDRPDAPPPSLPSDSLADLTVRALGAGHGAALLGELERLYVRRSTGPQASEAALRYHAGIRDLILMFRFYVERSRES